MATSRMADAAARMVGASGGRMPARSPDSDAAGSRSGQYAADNSQRGPGDSVQDHQAQYVGAARAERDADADFVNPLRYRVHEQREDSGHRQRQGAAREERRAASG